MSVYSAALAMLALSLIKTQPLKKLFDLVLTKQCLTLILIRYNSKSRFLNPISLAKT